MALCWIPTHGGIPGNEKAILLEKVAFLSVAALKISSF